MTYNTLIILALNHSAWLVLGFVSVCVPRERVCGNGDKILTQLDVCDKRHPLEKEAGIYIERITYGY